MFNLSCLQYKKARIVRDRTDDSSAKEKFSSDKKNWEAVRILKKLYNNNIKPLPILLANYISTLISFMQIYIELVYLNNPHMPISNKPPMPNITFR
jgi:hypothetical protein